MNVTNVLVVDDDAAVCRILHRMLSDEQYQVHISQSVGDAVAAIEQKLFDVYIFDYKLPDGTGLDVAERVRSKGSDAPIILISGYDPSAVALRAEKLHIFDIIEKPFSRAMICDAVKKAIGFTPTPDQNNAQSVSPASGEPADRAERRKPAERGEPDDAAATKKRFPKAAIIGAIIFLLLLICLAIYLYTHAH